MNKKEVNEIRRRLSPVRSAISRIYGCYVNTNREIISYLEEPFGLMPEFETDKYFSLLKKVLSGTMGRNLIDIVFSTQQVADSDEHRLLSALRSTRLQDRETRDAFYQKVIDSLEMDGSNYLILLACDSYDVPARGKDDETQEDASDTVFTYVVCCICPVRDGKTELGYFPGENEFHSCTPVQIVEPPELGFLFPAFDDRAANIYNALFYSKIPGRRQQECIHAVSRTDPPMSADEQKETFESALTDALEDGCSYHVMQSVHEQLRERIQEHAESKDPEPLDLSPREVGQILQSCDVPEEQVRQFQHNCAERFGEGAALNPGNIIDSKRFEIRTPQVKIAVDPAYSYLVETRIIDGRKCLVIPADEGVEVNGVRVRIDDEEE